MDGPGGLDRPHPSGPNPGSVPTPWPAVLAALAANLVGVGLGRFAYAPLVPALITEGWFSASAAAYLGAANLAGYLAGALLAPRIPSVANTDAVLRGMML